MPGQSSARLLVGWSGKKSPPGSALPARASWRSHACPPWLHAVSRLTYMPARQRQVLVCLCPASRAPDCWWAGPARSRPAGRLLLELSWRSHAGPSLLHVVSRLTYVPALRLELRRPFFLREETVSPSAELSPPCLQSRRLPSGLNSSTSVISRSDICYCP